MNYVRSNNVSLKYQRFTSSGYKVIGFTKIEFVAKSQFLCHLKFYIEISVHLDVPVKTDKHGNYQFQQIKKM